MFCRNCGSKIDDTAAFCPHCGVPTDDSYYTKTQQQNQQSYGQVQQSQQYQQPYGQAQQSQQYQQPYGQAQQSQQYQQPYGQNYQQSYQQYGQTYQQPYAQTYQQAPVRNGAIVTAAKVFMILGFVAFGIGILALIICLFTASSTTSYLNYYSSYYGYGYENSVIFIIYLIYFIVLAVFGSIGVGFGAKALKCISRGVKPSTATCVCVLIFNSIIAGILLLCSKNNDYKL